MKKAIIFGTIACAVVAGVAIYYAKRDREYEEVDTKYNNDNGNDDIQETSDKEIRDDYEVHKMNTAQTIADRHREAAQNMKVMNDFVERKTEGIEERKTAIGDMLDEIENLNNEG